MHDMGAKRGRPPEGSAAAIRAADSERPPKHTSGRRYTPEFKARILKAVDEATASGEHGALGALLRREGLNWPTVNRWREQRQNTPKKLGRPAKQSEAEKEVERLRRENERLQRDMRKAEIIIDVQKKLGALLGIEVPDVSKKDETP
jgi:transposase